MYDLTYNALIDTLEIRDNIIKFYYLKKNGQIINVGDKIHFDGDILEVLEHTTINSEYGTLVCKINVPKGIYDLIYNVNKCKEMSIEDVDKWIIIYEKCLSEPVLSKDLMDSIAIRLRDLKFEKIFREIEKNQ